MRALQIEDWLDDLGEFPAQYVSAAVKSWRQGEFGKRRPTPADIRQLCIAEQRAHMPAHERAAVPVEVVPEEHIVRRDWRKIPFPQLSKAERAQFQTAARQSLDNLPDDKFRDALNAMRHKLGKAGEA